MTTRRSAAKSRTDYALLLAVIALAVIGLIMVYSATFVLGDDSFHYLKLQVMWMGAGAVALLVMSRLDYRLLRRYALPIMGVAVLSLVGVLAMGYVAGGAQSWLLKGRVQPSEFAKLAFIIYIAAWLSSKGDEIRDVTYGLIPFAVLLGVITGLIILQPDLGAAVLIVVTAGSMFFIAGAEISQLIIAVLTGVPALCAIILTSDYARARVQVFLHPESDIQGAGYQIHTVLQALSAGGFLGRGLGAGTQKYVEPWVHHTDTIFAVIGEELGLVGCLVVIGLFLFIAYRGLLVSFRAPDTFGTLLALGVTCWIFFQAVVHMAVNTATMPFTGLTLPFVSYGGSSLVSCLAGVGVLLSISRVGKERERRSVAAFAIGGRHRRPRLSSTRRR
jgi:cell division protein FtsW